MKSTIVSAKKLKKRGRPPVDTSAVNLRLSDDVLRELDEWRRNQPDLPNRQEAIRRLLAQHLKSKGYLPK